MMEKDLLNELWMFIAQTSSTRETLLSHLKFGKKVSLLNYLVSNGFVIEVEGKLSIPVEVSIEWLSEAVIARLNLNYIEQYISISPELKKSTMEMLLIKNFNKRQEPFEKVKNDKWVFLLNDVNVLVKKYKFDSEFELELDVLKRFKKVLETKIKNGER